MQVVHVSYTQDQVMSAFGFGVGVGIVLGFVMTWIIQAFRHILRRR